MMLKKQKYVLPTQNAIPDAENPDFKKSDNNGKMFKKQAFAATVACLGGLSMGAVGGYTSPALTGIKHEFMLSDEQLSLVTSIALLASLPGGFIGGPVSDYFGRKLSLIFICVVCAIGWFLLVLAPNLACVYAGRAITGLGQGMISTCTPVYVAEVAAPAVRGKLGSEFQFFVALGILYAYVMGVFLSWNQLALACLVVSAVQAVLMLILPETPYWYEKCSRHEDALAALKWLDRSDVPVVASDDNLNFRSLVDPALLKPLVIVATQMLVAQCSGVTVVIVYAASIFQAAEVSLDANVCSIIVASSMLIAVVAAYILVDRLGRRILLLTSGFLMSLGTISLGAYYYVRANHPDSVGGILWLPIAALVTYIFAFGIGFGPVPWIMMGELFPTKARGLASGVITTLKWTMAFVTAKTYVDLKNALYDHGVFWLFGGVAVSGLAFAYFFVPETKGKTLEELDSYFKREKKVKSVTGNRLDVDTSKTATISLDNS